MLNRMLVWVVLHLSVLKNYAEKKILNAIEAHKTMATISTISSTVAIQMRRTSGFWTNHLVEAVLKNLSPSGHQRLLKNETIVETRNGVVCIDY